MHDAGAAVFFEGLLSLLVGLGLSAACGFRIFVPPLIASIAAFSGHLVLPAGFAWLGTWYALAALTLAVAIEALGYYLPAVDHVLDLIALPAATVAGILLTASFATGFDPFMQWAIAGIAGGGSALVVKAATTAARSAATVVTARVGNVVLATVEPVAALVVSALAVLAPVVAVGVVVALVVGLLVAGVKTWKALAVRLGLAAAGRPAAG